MPNQTVQPPAREGGGRNGGWGGLCQLHPACCVGACQVQHNAQQVLDQLLMVDAVRPHDEVKISCPVPELLRLLPVQLGHTDSASLLHDRIGTACCAAPMLQDS